MTWTLIARAVSFGTSTRPRWWNSASIAETAKALNSRGYRTKGYTSRWGKHHPGKPFNITSVQYMLKNPAYIGKKEINKKAKARCEVEAGYRLVDAVWPAIVDEEKFEQVQRLTPFERKELIRLALWRVEVSERQIVLELYPIQAP